MENRRLVKKEILRECSCCHKKVPGVKLCKSEDWMTGEVYEDYLCPHCVDQLALEL